MGITLGIVCAGLLLQIGSTHAGSVMDGPNTLLDRLRFLLGVAFFFGVGATLTGATFLAREKSGSKK